MVARAGSSVLFTALLTLAGCIILPIPTPEWGDEPITREQIDELEAGVGRLTRDDVTALIGSPQQRYADDRVLVYNWTRSQGIWIVGVANQGGISSGESDHRLCLLFSENGLLESTRHIDSAMGQSDAMVASLLDEWVGDVGAEPSTSGLARNLDVDTFSMTRRTEDSSEVIGVLVYSEGESPPSCFDEIDALLTDPYRAYSRHELRDRFYPWLEPPWYEHLERVATDPILETLRQETGLRFVVIAAIDNVFPNQLCDVQAPFTVNCYKVEYESQFGKIALLDLQSGASDQPDVRQSTDIPRIPKFPTNRRATCQILSSYVANDIDKLVHRKSAVQ